MPHRARPHIVKEATYRQLLDLKPNVAILPWAATEAHNYHLPYGTDIIEAEELAAAAAGRADRRGARCIVLPCVPFGIDHTQLDQSATITMRASTQAAILHDVADSLVRQGIERLVVLNFHGGNEFKPLLRDVMLDLPIFIVQVNGYQLDPRVRKLLADPAGDHADEFETAMLLHLTPDLVAPLSTAGAGKARPFKLKTLHETPGVWCSRNWGALTHDTGVGDPRQATAEKGRKIVALLTDALVPVLVELSKARAGDFPFVIERTGRKKPGRRRR